MLNYAFDHPVASLQLPHQWFQNDIKIAMRLVEKATRIIPSTKPAAAIWLGHVLSNPEANLALLHPAITK